VLQAVEMVVVVYSMTVCIAVAELEATDGVVLLMLLTVLAGGL